MLDFSIKDCENFSPYKFVPSPLFLLTTYSQYFHHIYDLIRPCKFSTISLKECSFEIFSSTFLME
jgi:hypothetical protein